MKRTPYSFIAAATAFAVAFLVLGCKNPTLQESHSASVTVSAPASASNKSRTLVPGFSNIAQYSWSASGPGGATQTKPPAAGGSVTFSNLLPGTWTFAATAYSASLQVLGSGSATAAIVAGANANIAILITVNGAGSGSGDLAINVVWPNDIDSVTGSISGGTLNAITPAYYDASNNKALVTNVASLSAGPHTLTLTFSRAGFAAGTFVEAVNIFNGQTTDHWIDSAGVSKSEWTLTSTDFLDASCSLASLQIPSAIGFTFYPNITDYTLSLSSPDSFTFTPKASLAGQRIYCGWNTFLSDLASGASQSVSFSSGANVFSIGVTAPDRGSSKTYNLHIDGYRLTYSPNGATGSGSPTPFSNVYTAGPLVLSDNANAWVKTGYNFAGWNTQANGSGTHYDASGTFSLPVADTSLFAEWISSSLATIIAGIHNGGSFVFPSMALTASELAMVKNALLGAIAPVTLDMSALSNTSLPAGTFSGCTRLTAISLPLTLTSVGDSCFSGCASLGALVIPDAVTTLGGYFVSGCSSLQTIALGAGVSGIGNDTFGGALPALTAITVSSSNSTLTDDSGVLYCTSPATLEKYPSSRPGSSYAVRSLANLNTENNSFLGCANLTLLVFPAHVGQIFNYSFDSTIQTIRFLDSSPPGYVAPGAFGYSSSMPPAIQVPAGTIAVYSSALGLPSANFSVYP